MSNTIQHVNIYLDSGKTVYCEPAGYPNIETLFRFICEGRIIEFKGLNLLAGLPTYTGQKPIDYLNPKKIVGIDVIREHDILDE